MKWTGILLEYVLFSILCSFIGCASIGSTRLCANFQSYQSLEDVQAELSRGGLTSGWSQESKGTNRTDPRRPYKLVFLSGAYQLSGIDGRLTFTFYNGQLMETVFTPEKGGEDYLTALRNEIPMMPQKPAEEIAIYRRTRFRFDVGPNGDFSFTWYDPKLQKQWRKWVASNG